MRMIFLITSREQGLIREGWSEGSSLANPRVDVQKSRRRLRSRMSQPKMTKSTEDGARVNAAATGRRFIFLPGEISKTLRAGVSVSATVSNHSCDFREVSRRHRSVWQTRRPECSSGMQIMWSISLHCSENVR